MNSNSTKKVSIKKDFCKGCRICIDFCPENAIESDTTLNPKGFHPVKWTGKCSFCGLCYTVCPDLAIEITENETEDTDK